MTARGLLLMLAAAAMLGAARPQPFDPFGAAGIDGRPGVQVPLDGAFRDETGRTVTLRALAHGRPLVIAPVQHRCPNLCGLTLDGLNAAVAGQSYRPGRDFALVALGIDPREGVDAAQVSRRRFAATPATAGGHALVGSAADIARVTAALGYRYRWDPQLQQYAHLAAVAVLTPDGRLSHWLYGVAPSPRDLHLALTDAGRGRLGGLGDQIRLLCYHYDPATGRYDSLVMTLARGLGAATTAALALLVGGLLWRSRARSRAA